LHDHADAEQRERDGAHRPRDAVDGAGVLGLTAHAAADARADHGGRHDRAGDQHTEHDAGGDRVEQAELREVEGEEADQPGHRPHGVQPDDGEAVFTADATLLAVDEVQHLPRVSGQVLVHVSFVTQSTLHAQEFCDAVDR
jgi:hypothetical protein